jgi:hypothetical protein
MTTIDFEKLGPKQKAEITDRVWWEELTFGLNPDTEIIKDPHWFQVITRSSRGILANSVSKCEVNEADIDKRIEQTFATYRSLGNPFHWVIAPSSRPRDLATRLVAAGMHHGGTSYGVIGDPRKVEAQMPSGVTIEPLTAKNVHEYNSVMSPDRFVEDHAVERHRKLVHHHLGEKTHLISHFLAKFQGRPAGIAEIRYHTGYAFIPGGRPQVTPEFANKGVFKALGAHLAADAAKRDFQVIATYAGKDCVPIWSKLGFEKTSDYEIYLWRPN